MKKPKKPEMPPEVLEFFRKTGSIGAKVGWAKLTPKERSEKGRRAGLASGAKRRRKPQALQSSGGVAA